MPGGQQPDAEGAAPAPASHWTRAYASYLRGGKADKTAPTDRDARDRLAKVVEILQRDAGIQQQQAAAAAPPADASADDIAAHVVGVVTASLREPLRKRVDDLERRRWRVPPALALGGGDVLVADVVRRCAQFVVLAKDFVGSAVGSASPEGGLAWAGVCFAVQFIENPIKGQETLLEGFEAVTELLHRFAAVEQSEAVRDPNGLLSKCLVQLYVAIIDFQARAIVHLDHRFARRVLSDTFKKDQWKDLIDTIKERKSLCNDALDDSLREQVDKRSEELKVLLDKQHNDVIAQLTNLEDGVKALADETRLADLRRAAASYASYDSDPSLSDNSGEPNEALSRRTARQCLPGTRVNLQREILDWAVDALAPDFATIMGMAGSGKSTLARSIASQISDAGYPVGSFFFSASEPARSGIGRVAATVASQLAILSTVVRSRVSEALKHGCDAVTNKKFDKQWELLIQEPVQSALECFSQVSRGQRGTGRELHHDVPIIFVIFDALDECEGGMVSQLIETLVRSSQALRGKGICLRILLTSRNEEALPLDDESAAEPPRWVLGDQPREEVEADLRVFYKSRLEEVQMERQQRVKRRRGRPQKPAGSSQRIPDDELDSLITRLVALSDHHFLHAEIACRIISGTGDDLKSSVTAFLEDSSTPGLDAVYLLALQRALLNEHRLTQEQRCRRFRLLAGMSVVAFEQLTLQNLSALSKASDTAETFTDDIEDFLFSLSAILHVPEQNGVAVRFVHLSFREFVLDSERCKDERFQVKPEDAHAAMFLGCLAVLDPPRTALSGGLHRNLGRLRSPVDHPYEQYSEDLLAQRRKRLLKYGLLSYSCRFWIAHLCRCTVTTDQLDIVCRFLERKSLEWIEALFWFYELVNVVSWLSSLDGLAKDIGNSTLQDLAFDLSVLIRENFYLIDKAPLQVYFMASLMASSKVMDKHRFLNNIHTGARLYRSPPANGSRLEFLDKRNVYLPVDHLIVLSNSRVNPFVTVKGGVLGTSLYLDGLGLPYRARQLEVIDNPTAGRFTPDGRYVVLGNAESTCVVDVRLQRVFSTSVVEKGWDFRGMVFSPEATTCVAWGSYEAMRAHHRPAQPSLAVWSTFNVRNSESNNPSTDQKLINRDVVPRRLDMPEEVLAVVHSTDGERLAVRLVSGAIIILDTEAYRKMESWECGDHQDDNNPMVPWATAMSMAPIGDDYHLAIFDGNRVQIWSAANRALLRTLDITGRSNWDGSSESLVVRYTRPLHSAEYDALMAIGARDSKDDDAYLGWSPEEDSASPLVVWETQSYSLLHLLHLNDHGFKYDISGNLDVLVSYRHDQDIKERAERTTTWGLRDHLFTNRSTCTQAAKVIRFPETPCRLPRFECIALSPKDQVAILTGNNEIWVWGFAAGSTARRLPCSFVNPNWDPGSDSWGADWWFAFSADEKRFAAVRDSHLAEWWDLEDETRCGTCRTKAAIHRISFDEEGVIQLLTDVISERDDGQGNDDRESSSNVAQRDASLGVPTTQKSIECAEPADVAGIERNVAIDTELSDGAVTDLEAKIRVEDDIFLVGGVALFRLPEYTALPRRRGYFLSDMSSTSEGTGTDAIAWQDRRTLEVFVVVGLSALARLWQEMPSDRGDDTPTPG